LLFLGEFDCSLRKFLYILGLNQKDEQNQKSQFYPADGGSFQFFPQTI